MRVGYDQPLVGSHGSSDVARTRQISPGKIFGRGGQRGQRGQRHSVLSR